MGTIYKDWDSRCSSYPSISSLIMLILWESRKTPHPLRVCLHTETLYPRRIHQLVPILGNLHPLPRPCPRHASLPSFRPRNVTRRDCSPRRVSFPYIFKTRHLASIVGIRNMAEEAYDSGSAEGQSRSAFITCIMGRSSRRETPR